MSGHSDEFGVRYVVVDETTWPVPDGAEWVLRYGTTEAREAQRLSVASIVNAYWSLLDPNRTQGDAIAMLRRARRAPLSDSSEPSA
jgi:hypothetical protein